MFVRLRWFSLGVLGTLGAGAYLLGKLRKMRARITRENVRRAGALSVADALDAAGRAVAPSSNGSGKG